MLYPLGIRHDGSAVDSDAQYGLAQLQLGGPLKFPTDLLERWGRLSQTTIDLLQ